jgi:hypothetical protein
VIAMLLIAALSICQLTPLVSPFCTGVKAVCTGGRDVLNLGLPGQVRSGLKLAHFGR